jgi:hypothetical protein
MKENGKPYDLSEHEHDASMVRERTLSHLENLMRTATSVGAGIVLACSARAQGQKPPQVCDPLPPPVGCCENPNQFLVRGCLDNQTRWVKLGKGWALELSLWIHAQPGRNQISFDGLKRNEIKVTGASVKDLKNESQKLGFVLAPIAGKRQVSVELAVQCNDNRIPLEIILDTSKPPAANRSVPVKLSNKRMDMR